MGIRKIADAKEDFDAWLEARKAYLTSSDFYTWIGKTPKWWSDTRDDVIDVKLGRKEKKFPPEVEVSVEHGSFDEENIMRKFSAEIGADVDPCNALTINDRWPHLAASIDGFVHRPTTEGVFKYAQDEEDMRSVREDLLDLLGDTPAVCEIKKSTSAGWSQGKVSEWYLPQVQGQLHILEMDYAVIVAETVLRMGHRLFWNLTADIIERDPAFVKTMDRLNKEFPKHLDKAK
jgi:hypothetical protein